MTLRIALASINGSYRQIPITDELFVQNPGTVALPGLAIGEADTGLFRPLADRLAVTASGVEIVRFQAPAAAAPQALFADSTAAAPGISSLTETNAGFAHIAVGLFSYCYIGAERWRFSGQNLYAMTASAEIGQSVTGGSFTIVGRISTTALPSISIIQLSALAFTGAAGILQKGIQATYVINQTSTAAFSAIQVVLTNTALGSGAQYFLDCQVVAGTSIFAITNGSTAALQGRVHAGIGAAATPSLSFLLRPADGFYTIGSSVMGVALGGQLAATWTLTNTAATAPWAWTNGTLSFSATTAIVQRLMTLTSTINQVSAVAAGFSALQINLTNTSLDTGAQFFLDLQVGGVTVAGITNGAVGVRGRLLAAAGAAATPAHSFIGTTDGFYSIGAGEIGTSIVGALVTKQTATTIEPNVDNVVSLGVITTKRWANVVTVLNTVGDMTMIDMRKPHGDESRAHWKIVEGEDEIYAYNIRTGRKFLLAMSEDPYLNEEDEARIAADRKMHGWKGHQ